MNILQHLPESKHGLVLVTLNPPFPVDPAKTVGRWQYDHPMMTSTSVSSQRDLPAIQNIRGISYVGAWTKYGFHEDGFTSAMRLVTAEPFNVETPFPVRSANRQIASPSFVESVARLVVAQLELWRRRCRPIWHWIAWSFILILSVVQRLTQTLGMRGATYEVVRLKECWLDGEDRKKR